MDMSTDNGLISCSARNRDSGLLCSSNGIKGIGKVDAILNRDNFTRG